MNFLSFILIGLFLFNHAEVPIVVHEHELIIFEGSDWCTNCNTLNNKILSTTPFQEYIVESKIEVIKVDFPQRKKQTEEEIEKNIQLAEKYKFDGNFPMIIISSKNKDDFQTLKYASSFTVDDLESQISEYLSKQN